jgi:hypothetical protein
MTATDINVGEVAIRRLAGQVFDAPNDRTKAKETVCEHKDANGTGKKNNKSSKDRVRMGRRRRDLFTLKNTMMVICSQKP